MRIAGQRRFLFTANPIEASPPRTCGMGPGRIPYDPKGDFFDSGNGTDAPFDILFDDVRHRAQGAREGHFDDGFPASPLGKAIHPDGINKPELHDVNRNLVIEAEPELVPDIFFYGLSIFHNTHPDNDLAPGTVPDLIPSRPAFPSERSLPSSYARPATRI